MAAQNFDLLLCGVPKALWKVQQLFFVGFLIDDLCGVCCSKKSHRRETPLYVSLYYGDQFSHVTSPTPRDKRRKKHNEIGEWRHCHDNLLTQQCLLTSPNLTVSPKGHTYTNRVRPVGQTALICMSYLYDTHIHKKAYISKSIYYVLMMFFRMDVVPIIMKYTFVVTDLKDELPLQDRACVQPQVNNGGKVLYTYLYNCFQSDKNIQGGELNGNQETCMNRQRKCDGVLAVEMHENKA